MYIFFSARTVFRRQILTSKDGPSTERVKSNAITYICKDTLVYFCIIILIWTNIHWKIASHTGHSLLITFIKSTFVMSVMSFAMLRYKWLRFLSDVGLGIILWIFGQRAGTVWRSILIVSRAYRYCLARVPDITAYPCISVFTKSMFVYYLTWMWSIINIVKNHY